MKTALATTMAMMLLLPAATRAGPPGGPIRAPCDVSVQFGSYAMGIDGRSFDKVQRYVARHPRLIVGSTVTPWGREGERTVCLTTRGHRTTTTVFGDIRGLIGKGRRGPVEVRAADGRVWRSNPGPPR